MSAVAISAAQMPKDTLAYVRKVISQNVQIWAGQATGGVAQMAYREAIANDFMPAAAPAVRGRLSSGVLVAQTWTQLFSFQVAQKQAFAVYGIAILSGNHIDAVRIRAGANVLAQIPISEIYATTLDVKAYWEPVVIFPTQVFGFDVLSDAGGTDTFELKAYIGEPEGDTVQPNKAPTSSVVAA